jgi:hypothetical protein
MRDRSLHAGADYTDIKPKYITKKWCAKYMAQAGEHGLPSGPTTRERLTAASRKNWRHIA